MQNVNTTSSGKQLTKKIGIEIANDFISDITSNVDWQQILIDILDHHLFPEELLIPGRYDERIDFAKEVLSKATELAEDDSAFRWVE